MSEILQVRCLTRQDWTWIREWYRDPELDAALGPVDEEWLDHVLTESAGAQLIIEADGEPVALVGAVWGPRSNPHVITDIAVAPSRREHGWGRLALDAALAWEGHPSAPRWRAYVEPHNRAARHFFHSLGWNHCGLEDDLHVFEMAARSDASTTSIDRPHRQEPS